MQGEPMRNEEEATIICRCEDISLEEIRAIINRGVTDPEQIKRILRCGMGPCQGRTCSTLIAGEIAWLRVNLLERSNRIPFARWYRL